MAAAFPWVRFLPHEDAQAFVVELTRTREAAGHPHRDPAPVLQVITEWRNTAAIHADPELKELVTAAGQGAGPVEPPRERRP